MFSTVVPLEGKALAYILALARHLSPQYVGMVLNEGGTIEQALFGMRTSHRDDCIGVAVAHEGNVRVETAE
jgi:hypothetical protein